MCTYGLCSLFWNIGIGIKLYEWAGNLVAPELVLDHHLLDRNEIRLCQIREDSTVTYTAVSSPFEDGSDIGSPGVDGPPIMPEDPYAYIMAAYQVPPSPDYIPGPEVPPSPDYIPGPEEP
ncbi:hypothetical protein Tco_0560494 [Tanacetum coccineum]